MTAPRRRLIRPLTSSPPSARQAARFQKLRHKLAQQQAALARWMTRLKRAFHAFERGQQSIARLERQLRTLEG